MNEQVPTAIAAVSASELQIFAFDKTIFGPDNLQIFDLTGRNVTRLNGQLNGVYIVKVGDKAQKVVVK